MNYLMDHELVAAVRSAKPCDEHGKDKCLYGCSHVRPDECEKCALNVAKAVREALRRPPDAVLALAEMTIEQLRIHYVLAFGMGKLLPSEKAIWMMGEIAAELIKRGLTVAEISAILGKVAEVKK